MIINKEIPYDEVYSDKECIAFKDIAPQAPIHFLIIPRKVISSLRNIEENDKDLLGHLLFVAKKIAIEYNLESWRTVINTGEGAGQTVFHLHIHILSGRRMKWPPG